jgi:hypothetical protein
LYRGGTIFGSPADAEANTWLWNEDTGKPHGYELRPDNATTTLFLPACGDRYCYNGLLYYQGNSARYWSSTVMGTTGAYNFTINNGHINPENTDVRGSGFALRCIKHQ